MSVLNTLSRLLGGKQPSLQQHREELLTSLLVMAWMVEARDPYTGGHLWRVSRFARLLAQAAGLPEVAHDPFPSGDSVESPAERAPQDRIPPKKTEKPPLRPGNPELRGRDFGFLRRSLPPLVEIDLAEKAFKIARRPPTDPLQ